MTALLRRGDPGYEQARVGRIFNARRPERYPAAILLAADAEDVAAGVRKASQNGWRVSIRSGGHSWAAWSLRDDALLIDLGNLNGLDYDDSTGVLTAGPAARGGLDVAPFLAERGRAFPGGHCPTVGLGGYLLQGGQGWNSRRMGWACENVVAVDVVTADGELVRADATHHSDLLWAARGAGPGFPGVVTAFHLQTYEAPAVMWHDTRSFRPEDGAVLLAWLHDILPSLDRRIEPVLAATRLPGEPQAEALLPLGMQSKGAAGEPLLPLGMQSKGAAGEPLLPIGKQSKGAAGEPPLPMSKQSKGPGNDLVLLLHTTVMAADEREAAALLRPFAEGPLAGKEIDGVTGPTSLAEECVAQDRQSPEGYRYAVDCTWTDAPADVLTPLLTRLWSGLDTPHSFSIWYGWAPDRPLPDMAFSVQGNVYVATYAIYDDAADDERYRSWVHERTADIARHGGVGVYLGDTDFTRRQDRFLSDANFRRLEEIRAARDPGGLFASYLAAGRDGLNVHG